MMKVIPVDRDADKTQNAAERRRKNGWKRGERSFARHLPFENHVAMATAKTPSLNASRRCLLIRDLRLSRSSTTHLCCRISDVNDRLQTINAALIPSLPALCPPEPEPAGLQDAGAERPASGRAFSLPFEVGVDGANGLRGFNLGRRQRSSALAARSCAEAGYAMYHCAEGG